MDNRAAHNWFELRAYKTCENCRNFDKFDEGVTLSWHAKQDVKHFY